MAKRIYAIEDVYKVACERANITPLQVGNTTEKNTPKWGPMARAAVIGAVYELCEISMPELAMMVGHSSHSVVLSQIQRFRGTWPAMIRRSWLESVLVGLDKAPYPEIKNP